MSQKNENRKLIKFDKTYVELAGLELFTLLVDGYAPMLEAVKKDCKSLEINMDEYLVLKETLYASERKIIVDDLVLDFHFCTSYMHGTAYIEPKVVVGETKRINDIYLTNNQVKAIVTGMRELIVALRRT